MGGAAIVGAGAESVVDFEILKAHGLKVRTSASTVPDLILSFNKHSAAYMLLPDSSQQPCKRYLYNGTLARY